MIALTTAPARTRRRKAGDPRRAVAYIRVSTEEQRLGPEEQRAAIERWAESRGVRVVAWCVEQGVSGAAPLDRRPALMDAIQAVAEHGAGLLVASKRDRVARDVMAAAMIERLTVQAGASLVTVDGVGAGDGPEAQLMRRMIDAFAEYERAVIRARTRAALKAKRCKGERAGKLPFGFELDPADPARQRMRKCDREQRAIKEALRLRKRGMTYDQIADALTERMPEAARGQRFYGPMLWRVIKQHTPTAG